jgi:hypothetical protein
VEGRCRTSALTICNSIGGGRRAAAAAAGCVRAGCSCLTNQDCAFVFPPFRARDQERGRGDGGDYYVYDNLYSEPIIQAYP